MDVLWLYLDKEWNGVEPSDHNPVVDIPGQDVQSSCATFNYFLHTHSLLDEFKGGEKKVKDKEEEKEIQIFKRES